MDMPTMKKKKKTNETCFNGLHVFETHTYVQSRIVGLVLERPSLCKLLQIKPVRKPLFNGRSVVKLHTWMPMDRQEQACTGLGTIFLPIVQVLISACIVCLKLFFVLFLKPQSNTMLND
jgi:hypothetical protein